MDDDSQWLFPLSALESTPTNWPLDRELFDRARAVEFLFRMGLSLVLPSSAVFTAATWFHRFYMRYSMEDFHRQDVAASCIFLATKTEECGRKLRDVARVLHAKTVNYDVTLIDPNSKEVERCQSAILATEEVLIEALCFDFAVENPHAKLADMFEAHEVDDLVQEHAWSFAHDSYRTPLCLLYPPSIIATACYVLAQRIVDGPNSVSLDARISSSAPSASLPTPPSHKPASPDASRFAIEYFSFNDRQLFDVSDALHIILEFYSVSEEQFYPWLHTVLEVGTPGSVPLPTTTPRPHIYRSFTQFRKELGLDKRPPPRYELPNATPSPEYIATLIKNGTYQDVGQAPLPPQPPFRG